MTWPLELYIASRYIRQNIRQSLIILLAVGIGVSIIIFIPSINLSFFGYFLEKTVENAAHIEVTRELDTLPRNRYQIHTAFPKADRWILADQTQTRKRNLKTYTHWMDEFQALPGVVETAPFVSEQIVVTHGSQVRGATLRGILPEKEMKLTNLRDHIKSGNLEAIGTKDVFLGWRLADELGVHEGNRVKLVTSEGSYHYKLAGLIDSGIYEKDLSTVLLSLPSAQQALNMTNEVTGIGIKIKDIYEAENLARYIARTYHLKAVSWMEENKVFLDQIANFRSIIAVISFLIVFAAASSITSILIMVVSSKSREIGILKAMGTTPGTIIRLFLIQAIFLSILGAIAGVFGGMGLISLYNLTPMATAETFLGVGREPVTLNVEYTFIAIFYAMLSSILASLFPAWQAGKLDPVKAIHD